jgi:hypothetical protein
MVVYVTHLGNQWQLSGGDISAVTGRKWPFSDRLFALNRPFRSKLPNLTVPVWPMPANGQRRP